MAPRKAAKHTDTEIMEKAADAGEVSPPKKRKVAAKNADKIEPERPVRLPRAAKSKKIEQNETEEKVAKKPRGKVTPKKAGMDGDKETEEKPKGRSKRNLAAEEVTEDPKATIVKKGRTAKTTEPAVKEDIKSKTKATKKKTDEAVITKSKVTNPKKKPTAGSDDTNNSNPKEKVPSKPKKTDKAADSKSKVTNTKKKPTAGSDDTNNSNSNEKVASKPKKQMNNEKPVKPAARNARAKKTEAASKNVMEDDEEVNGENDIPAASPENSNEDNHEHEMDTAQTTKKARNTKKKGESAPPAKTMKPRGKAANHIVETASNDKVSDNPKADTVSQKKVNKENASSTADSKKGRAKEVVTTAPMVEDAEIENVKTDTRTVNSRVALVNNNNKQELFEQIQKNERESDEEEDGDFPKLNVTETIMDKKNDYNENNTLMDESLKLEG